MRKTFTFEGKRYDVTAKDETELAVKIALKKKALEEGTLVVTKNTVVSRWADEWLETYKKDSVGKATYELYKANLKLHVLPAIGNLRLKDVKPVHLQKILNSRAGYSKSHILKVRQLLQQLFAEARNNKLILDNPAENLKMPKATDGTHRAITDKERKFILQLSEAHRNGLWILIMLYCGLRPQETATLQWKNVDLKNKVVTIETAREALTNNIKVPKSDAGLRKVPIPGPLLKRLLKEKGEPFEYVFTQLTTRKRHTQSSMRCLWTSFKRDLNIAMGCKVYRNQLIPPFPVAEDLVPYCFRHTFCTDLQTAGVPINVAKELMGHEDISTTSKIYTHKSEIVFNNAAELMNNFHNPKETPTPTPTFNVCE